MSTAIRLDRPTVLRHIPYGVYLRIRAWNHRYRMTYYDGTLEIMSPHVEHELPSDLLRVLVAEVARAFHIPHLGVGSTTFSLGAPDREEGAGKEPDRSFYFRDNVATVRATLKAKQVLRLPPDLWIEVDHRGSSKGRLPLYARLRVPEVWRYRAPSRRLWFGLLEGEQYVAAERSAALPMLTTKRVLQALRHFDRHEEMDEGAWRDWLSQWVLGLRNS